MLEGAVAKDGKVHAGDGLTFDPGGRYHLEEVVERKDNVDSSLNQGERDVKRGA